MKPAEAEVAQIVRQSDPDRYLSSLYAPEGKRSAILALYAFNVELASVRDKVSQPLTGEMRFQWWRDLLAGAHDAAAGHPVAMELLSAIREHRLPVQTLQNMIDARIFDLYDDPMPSRTDLEGYCGETASALIQLSALVLDSRAAAGTADVAGHAGCAQAITGILRLLPIHRRRGQCYVPADILAAAGTTRDALLAGEDKEGAARAVAAMAALARGHLTAFKEGASALPVSLRPAYLQLAPVGVYLAEVEKDPERALETSAGMSAVRRHWLMLKHAMRGW